jgi:hypothetical protein
LYSPHGLLRTGRLACLALSAALAVSHAAPLGIAQEPPGQTSDVEALVRQLGDDSFAARSAAVEKLLAIGAAALPALRETARLQDVELRCQARRLIALIEASDYEQRLAAFLEDRSGAEPPGWERFRCVCGEGHAARRMFVALLRAEPRLWHAAARGERAEVDREFEQRCRDIEGTSDYRRRREAPWETVCTLLLLAADPQARLEYQSSFAVYNLASHTALDAPLASAENGAMVKRLLARWVEQGDRAAAILRFQLAYRHRLPECLAPALELLRDDREKYVHHKALLVAARFGKPQHLDVVQRFLDDPTILYKRADTGYTCQCRDAALTAAVRLSGRDPAEFGFEQLKADEFHLYEYNSVGFASDDQRQAALARWRAWKSRADAPPGASR